MDRVVARVGVTVVLLLGPLVIGIGLSGSPGDGAIAAAGSEARPVTVDTLLSDRPEGAAVQVTGTVTTVLQDHVSETGNTYQQFYVDDGTGEILVFCSTERGRVAVQEGDRVSVPGTFKEFYGTPEVYTACSRVQLQ